MAVSGKGYVLNGLLQLNRYKRNSSLVKDSVGEAGSVVVSDLLFGASSGQTLTPGLYSNTPTFYSPTVSVGAVNLTVGLFTNTSNFYSAVISTGPVTLTPNLFTNTSTFYAANVFDPDAVSTIRYDISTGRLVKIINNYVCISL